MKKFANPWESTSILRPKFAGFLGKSFIHGIINIILRNKN